MAVVPTWLAACGMGLLVIGHFDASPAPGRPEIRSVSRPKDAAYHMIVAVDPRYSATVATLISLQGILAHVRGPHDARIHIDAYMDRSTAVADSRASAGSLLRMAADLPYTTMHVDANESVATSVYRMTTSGEVLLYRPDGALGFAGTVTAPPGQADASTAEKAVVAVLQGRVSHGSIMMPVYGCPLRASRHLLSSTGPPRTDPARVEGTTASAKGEGS
jgi:hypothetical protein